MNINLRVDPLATDFDHLVRRFDRCQSALFIILMPLNFTRRMPRSIDRWAHRRSRLRSIAIADLSRGPGYYLGCIQHLYALMMSTHLRRRLYYFALSHFVIARYESRTLSITHRRWTTLIFSILRGGDQHWCLTTHCVCCYLMQGEVGNLTPAVTLVNGTSQIAILCLDLPLELFNDAAWVITFFAAVVDDWRVGAVVVVLWCLFEEERRGAARHLVWSSLRRWCRHACHIVPSIVCGCRLHDKFCQLINHVWRWLSWRFSPRHGWCGWMTLMTLMCSWAFRRWYDHFASDGVIESFCLDCAAWLEAWCLLVLSLGCFRGKWVLTLVEALA